MKRHTAKTVAAAFGILLLLPACKEGEESSGGDKDGGIGGSSDSSSGGGDAPALMSFCNPLALGTEDVVLSLVVGEGASQVTLSSSTQTCSNRLGDSCPEIPTGPAIPLVLQDASGTVHFSTTLDVSPEVVYMAYATVDAEGHIALDHGTLFEALDCADMECTFVSYNDRTCGADDPCGWNGNGTCDDYCLERLPPGGNMFDDSVDCRPAR